MPKANKVGKSRINAKSDKLNESSRTTDDVPNRESKTPQLSRGQKKKLAKRQQYEARMKMVNNSLLLQSHRSKKKSDCLLSGLSSALPSVPSPSPPPPPPKQTSIKTNLQKQKLSIEEKAQHKLVLEHPTFKSNPFEAIKLHLNNSLAEAVPASKKVKEVKVKRNGSRKRN
ncbi:hypothetical protein TrST_g2844 [Triparma strigata]|uniref:Ribosome biogenesis protein SLX9 n=1 Tax=Triparma strigata TaxID=1606541 RepID=A0A9W7B5N9_9STRA|nr:hypothetical protein TrST_g2844 [Triparma strigata]